MSTLTSSIFLTDKNNKTNKVFYTLFLKEQFNYLKTTHSYHLVDPSPWPLAGALGGFMITSGLVLYMHKYIGGWHLFLTGLLFILYVMYGWWRDVIREATFEDQHSIVVQKGLKLGMILFIASEIMFFFAFFWAFFHSSVAPVYTIGGVWPPYAITTINTYTIPLANTFILLTSGATITWSHHAILARSKKQTILSLLITLILAVLFTCLQVLEYMNSPFNISDGVYGSCFYLATGFHGFHVVCTQLLRQILERKLKTKVLNFEKASVHSNNLGLNSKGKTTQKYLLYFLHLFYKSKTWNNNNSLFFGGSNKDNHILSDRLNWKIIYIFRRKGGEEIPFFKSCFKASKKKICKNLKIKLNFCLLSLDNDNTRINVQKRSFSTVLLLKTKIDTKFGKFKNIFSIIYSINNIYEAKYEIESLTNSIIRKDSRFKTLKKYEFDWLRKISLKVKLKNNRSQDMSYFFLDQWNQKNKKIIISSSFKKKVIRKAILRVTQFICKGASFWKRVNFDIFKNFRIRNKLPHEIKRKRNKIQNKLEIYEIKKWILKPTFSTSSCFSDTSSTHLSLKSIKKTWISINQFWSFDISKVFKKINHNKLICEIEKIIYDCKFITSLRKILKAEIIHLKTLPKNLRWKMFQSSITFFLWNVYLISFDKLITKLKKKYNQKKFVLLYDHYQDNTRSIVFEQNVYVKNPIKVNYMRLSSNILFGFPASKLFAKRIKKCVQTFVKLELELDYQMTDLRKKWFGIQSTSINFLGFKIERYTNERQVKPNEFIGLYKLKRSIRRNKLVKLNKHLKKRRNILFKMHKNVINFMHLIGKVLIKKVSMKSVVNYSSLKNSISKIESEILVSPLISKPLNQIDNSSQTGWALEEKEKLNSIKILTQKWLQQAKSWIIEDEYSKNTFESFWSSKFIKVKRAYIKELEIVLSTSFNKNVVELSTKNMKRWERKSVSKSIIRILFPRKAFLKTLRSLKIVNKVTTKFIGINFLLSLKDQDIISWFSLKAKSIWSYYSCVDNIKIVKKVLVETLRYSLLSVLQEKYKSNLKITMLKDSSNISAIHHRKNMVNCTKNYFVAFNFFQEHYSKNPRKFRNNPSNFLELKRVLKLK